MDFVRQSHVFADGPANPRYSGDRRNCAAADRHRGQPVAAIAPHGDRVPRNCTEHLRSHLAAEPRQERPVPRVRAAPCQMPSWAAVPGQDSAIANSGWKASLRRGSRQPATPRRVRNYDARVRPELAAAHAAVDEAVAILRDGRARPQSGSTRRPRTSSPTSTWPASQRCSARSRHPLRRSASTAKRAAGRLSIRARSGSRIRSTGRSTTRPGHRCAG